MFKLNAKNPFIFTMLVFLVADCKPRGATSLSAESDHASLFTSGNRLADWNGKDEFLSHVQPVIASRCVACHGCTDAPCSAKFTSYEGLARGGSKDNPYSVHPLETNFQEMKVGAKGFFPLFN